MPSIVFNTNRNNLEIVAKGNYFPSLRDFFAILFTFSLTVFAWIFFRAENVTHAFNYISEIFSNSILSVPYFPKIEKAYIVMVLIEIFIGIEWLGREEQFALRIVSKIKRMPLRILFYYAVIFAILFFGNFSENQFIYFQF
jgi:hypothetical protein